jgi:hypothetical protein
MCTLPDRHVSPRPRRAVAPGDPSKRMSVLSSAQIHGPAAGRIPACSRSLGSEVNCGAFDSILGPKPTRGGGPNQPRNRHPHRRKIALPFLLACDAAAQADSPSRPGILHRAGWAPQVGKDLSPPLSLGMLQVFRGRMSAVLVGCRRGHGRALRRINRHPSPRSVHVHLAAPGLGSDISRSPYRRVGICLLQPLAGVLGGVRREAQLSDACSSRGIPDWGPESGVPRPS